MFFTNSTNNIYYNEENLKSINNNEIKELRKRNNLLHEGIKKEMYSKLNSYIENNNIIFKNAKSVRKYLNKIYIKNHVLKNIYKKNKNIEIFDKYINLFIKNKR